METSHQIMVTQQMMSQLVLFVVTAVWDMNDVMEGRPDAHYRSLNGPNPR